MYLSALLLPALFYFCYAAPIIESPPQLTCADQDSSVTICAEIYNSTDCTGPVTVVTASKRECHNVPTYKSGSIHVRRGSVFAGFFYDNCKIRPEVFTGPMWREEDQGCQKLGAKRAIRSWDAW